MASLPQSLVIQEAEKSVVLPKFSKTLSRVPVLRLKASTNSYSLNFVKYNLYKLDVIPLEEKVNNSLTRLTIAPASPTRLLGTENPNPAQARSFNWSYLFSDGTRLVGRVSGQLDRDGNRLLNPKLLAADYLDVDGETVLLSWSGSDFVCFDATVDGNDNCVVASNDNFLANSMSLVSFETRSRAQVTDWGSQLIVEPFESAAWLLMPEESQVSVGEGEMGLDLALYPFFPFFFPQFQPQTA